MAASSRTTYDGFVRFDGVDFTVYRLRTSPFTIYGTPEGLESSNIYPIYEDRSDPGTIWVGTLGGGLSRLQDGSVRTFGPEEGVPSIV